MRVVWTRPAMQDLKSHALYHASYNSAAAVDLVQRLIGASEGLAIFPNRGRPTRNGERELTIIRPYVIVYKVENDILRILRVWHGAQDRAKNEDDGGDAVID